MAPIAREADRHTRRGFELAGRNAVFAARSQFIVALRLLAQGLDAEHGGGHHTRALAEGLDALQEAGDFIPRDSRVEADVDLAAIIRRHRTTVLKPTDLDGLTPIPASKAYFTFAQERLVAAAGGEVAGSMALHGLGKIHAIMARDPAIDLTAAEPRAVVFLQAALRVYPWNLMAANDLGVLLSRAGRWEEARQVLEHAVSVNPRSVSWQDLAVVYRQLGNATMAEDARRTANASIWGEMVRRGGRHGSEEGQWLAPSEYAVPSRLAHVAEYRLRVDDELELMYRLTREEMPGPYRLEVGDEIRVESFTDPELDRDLLIQPDGTITLRLLGQVQAAHKSVAALTADLEHLYAKYYKVPAITVTPLKVNTRLEDFRAAVSAGYGRGGLQRFARVTPAGDIALPVLGSVFVQGLTLTELGQELNERYREHISGIDVVPVLVARAPRYIYEKAYPPLCHPAIDVTAPFSAPGAPGRVRPLPGRRYPQ